MVKAVILAGGLGTRLSEETGERPKPMVEVGGKPILWHIMKIYSTHGINDFIICLGYKGYVIKEYFANYDLYNSDINFNFANNSKDILNNRSEKWNVTLIDTGENTMTGGRIKRILPYVANDEYFCLTYGDGVSDIDIKALIDFHKAGDRLATLTSVKPDGRFGALQINEDHHITQFTEKPKGDGGYINGGFFVLSPKIGQYIKGDETVWEQEPLGKLTEDKELRAYKHEGFWKPMDTLRDKHYLNDLYKAGNAKWKIWS